MSTIKVEIDYDKANVLMKSVLPAGVSVQVEEDVEVVTWQLGTKAMFQKGITHFYLCIEAIDNHHKQC